MRTFQDITIIVGLRNPTQLFGGSPTPNHSSLLPPFLFLHGFDTLEEDFGTVVARARSSNRRISLGFFRDNERILSLWLKFWLEYCGGWKTKERWRFMFLDLLCFLWSNGESYGGERYQQNGDRGWWRGWPELIRKCLKGGGLSGFSRDKCGMGEKNIVNELSCSETI